MDLVGGVLFNAGRDYLAWSGNAPLPGRFIVVDGVLAQPAGSRAVTRSPEKLPGTA